MSFVNIFSYVLGDNIFILFKGIQIIPAHFGSDLITNVQKLAEIRVVFGTGLVVAQRVGILLAAINMGRRRSNLATAGDRLFVVRESIFGRKTHEWKAADLEEIRRGASGTTVNDVPVLELQIHPRQGKKVGLLSERDNGELTWIAAELNQALGLLRVREGS